MIIWHITSTLSIATHAGEPIKALHEYPRQEAHILLADTLPYLAPTDSCCLDSSCRYCRLNLGKGFPQNDHCFPVVVELLPNNAVSTSCIVKNTLELGYLKFGKTFFFISSGMSVICTCSMLEKFDALIMYLFNLMHTRQYRQSQAWNGSFIQ